MKIDPQSNWNNAIDSNSREALSRFLRGEESARDHMTALVNAAIDGRFDPEFAGNPDPKHVHVTTSCHLMVLKLLHHLKGLNAKEFYKGDPLRYVRLNCLVQRILGIKRLTLGWPVYAFGAEILGQTMIYPQDQAPGSDPGVPMLGFDNWRELPEYSANNPLAGIIRENLLCMAQLSKIEPVAHMPAPYSLAAEIFGQEALLSALATQPEFVHEFLDLIVDRVLVPWCNDLVAKVPSVWLELSDASGSPIFIGPNNFLKFAVDPVLRLMEKSHGGDRIFIANYRGDLPPPVITRQRRGRRLSKAPLTSFESLLQAKKLCCPHFLMRLEADAAPVERYVGAAIDLQMPLYLGIGAVRLDRNSNHDIAAAKYELSEVAKERAGMIHLVSQKLNKIDLARSALPWPGDLYIEDINGETDIALIQAVLAGTAEKNLQYLL